MRKTNIIISDTSVYVDKWSYKKPSFKPNEDGEIELSLQLCFGPCEWWKWSIDKQGKFWVEYRWCENDFFEDESFREEYSREKMVEKMQEMQTFFEGYGLDEYVEIYKNAEKFVKMYGDNLDT